jgi:hypothetical protein
MAMKVEDRLDGANNFRAWKLRITVILEEFDLQDFVELDLPEPEGEEELVKFRKDRARVRRILIESIKDNLIPYVSELKKPKEIFDALARLYESKNTSRKMTLRNQLRVTKMNKNDSIASYFMKISQIKDQLIAINEQIDDSELTTLTLNGFPTSWRPFVQGICARNKLPKFDKLWADCAQEEARLQSLDDPEDEEDQALTAHSKKGKRKSSHKVGGRRFPDKRKDLSHIRCFNCDKKGHFAKDCPEKSNKEKDNRKFKGKGKRKHHAHAADDKGHRSKRSRVETSSSSDDEFTFISALTGTITHDDDVWLIDSGASKHMTGNRASLKEVEEKKNSSQQVEIGDNSKHDVKGVGEASFRLDSGKSVNMKNILQVSYGIEGLLTCIIKPCPFLARW